MGRGRGSDRSRRGWSTRCRWHRMAGVTAGLARRRGHQRIVQVPPVARLDVLPGLVVGESGLVAQRRGRRVGIFCLATGGLGQHTKRQAQHQRRCQAVSELVHCSKPCEKAGEVPADAHACAKRTHEPHGPPAEASKGQMVRGGRSWPSDWNVGAGAKRWGKPAVLSSTGVPSPAAALGTGGVEHEAEHMLHLSGPDAWEWSAVFSSWCECSAWSWTWSPWP